MILQSERLYVRKYTPADEVIFYRINSDEEVMRYIRPVKTREASKAFLLQNLELYEKHPGLGRWANSFLPDGIYHEHGLDNLLVRLNKLKPTNDPLTP